MRLLFAIATLTLLAPVASASGSVCVPLGVGGACVFDENGSAGSCDTQGYAYGYDLVLVVTPVAFADAYAGRSCYAGPGLSQETSSVGADAFTPVVAAQFHWASATQTDAGGEHASCSMQVVVGAVLVGWYVVSQPCVAGGPPDAGWGHLLP